MKKEKPVTRFVVFPQKMNRTPAGIHERRAAFEGDMAFVYSYDAKSADIVPRANCFEKLEDAKLYFSGLGQVRWIVMTAKSKHRSARGQDMPLMFQGRVAFRINTSRYASRRFETIVQDMNGKLFENISFDTQYFDTKKQAESAYAHLWKEDYRRSKEEAKNWADRLHGLIMCKPRSKRKMTVDQRRIRVVRENLKNRAKLRAKKMADRTEE